jgi:hypothetical protein
MNGALKDGKRNRNRPDNCVSCGVPMLTRKPYAMPPEGYEWHEGKGNCRKCYYSQSRPAKGLAVTNCRDCGRPLRLQNQTIAERPGTLKHAGRGLCNTHYEIRRGNGTLPDVAEIGHPDPPKRVPRDHEAEAKRHENTAAGYDRWLKARNERIGRQTRLAMIRKASA